MRRFFSFILLALIVSTNLSGCSRYDKHVPEVLAEIAKSKDNTSLSGITSYEWDKVYVIGIYESFDCSVIKGVPRKVKKRIKYQELNATSFVLLFTLNQKFVSCTEVDRRTADELGLKGSSVYTPDTVIPFREEDFIMINYKNNKRPKFDGDMDFNKLNAWVENNLRYPEKAKEEGIQGRVTIGFTITKEGRQTNVKVLKGCHPLLDAEAVRVIETTAGKWTCGYLPGTDNPVDVAITCPIVFQL